MDHPMQWRLPPEIAKLAPKPENYEDKEEYEEAKAFFLHRVKHLARPMNRRARDAAIGQARSSGDPDGSA